MPTAFISGRQHFEHHICSFARNLNLLWGRVIDVIEAWSGMQHLSVLTAGG